MRTLFGDRVAGFTAHRRTVHIDHCRSPEEFREYWKRNYGPTIAVYRHVGDDAERVAQLDRDFLEFLTRWNLSTDSGRTAYDAEYLIVTATKV